MKRFVNPANVITSCGLGAGFLAVLLASDGALSEAAIFVALAVVLDALDGGVARRGQWCGTFGCQLDSLSDLVGFGVAPALMIHKLLLHSMPVVGAAAGVLFVIAGAWRLARFAVVKDLDYFVGLPIPPAGLIVAVAAALPVPVALSVGLCLVLALLMVCSVRVPSLLTLRRVISRRPQRLVPRPPLRSHSLRRRSRPVHVSRIRGR